MNDSSTNSCCEPVRTPAVPDDAAIGRTQKLVAAGGILGAIARHGGPMGKLATASARRLKLTPGRGQTIDVSTSPGSQAQLERWVACPGRTNASPKHL
jgi:hypothetical protein